MKSENDQERNREIVSFIGEMLITQPRGHVLSAGLNVTFLSELVDPVLETAIDLCNFSQQSERPLALQLVQYILLHVTPLSRRLGLPQGVTGKTFHFLGVSPLDPVV